MARLLFNNFDVEAFVIVSTPEFVRSSLLFKDVTSELISILFSFTWLSLVVSSLLSQNVNSDIAKNENK
ncbi:hypothetical protein D3C85_1435220 [compost metagenome]